MRHKESVEWTGGEKVLKMAELPLCAPHKQVKKCFLPFLNLINHYCSFLLRLEFLLTRTSTMFDQNQAISIRSLAFLPDEILRFWWPSVPPGRWICLLSLFLRFCPFVPIFLNGGVEVWCCFFLCSWNKWFGQIGMWLNGSAEHCGQTCLCWTGSHEKLENNPVFWTIKVCFSMQMTTLLSIWIWINDSVTWSFVCDCTQGKHWINLI